MPALVCLVLGGLGGVGTALVTKPEADPEPEPDTSELEPVAAQPPLEGVTPSADWSWDEPEDYSAPV